MEILNMNPLLSNKSRVWGIDIETTGIQYFNNDLRIIGFCNDAKQKFWIRIENLKKELFKKFLKQCKIVICHNSKFELHYFFDHLDIPIGWVKLHDTMVMGHLVNENLSKKLNDQSLTYLGKKKTDLKFAPCKAHARGKAQDDCNDCETFRSVDLTKLAPYCENDCLLTMELFDFNKDKIFGTSLEALYYMEIRLIDTVCRMEHNGIAIDVEKMEEYYNMAEKKKNKIAEPYKCEKMNSAKDLIDAIERVHGFRVEELTEKGNQQLDKSVLEKHDLADLLLYRRYHNVQTFLGAKFRDNIDNESILHPSYLSTGTRIGRFACMSPNTQNLPKRNELAEFPVRQLFYNNRGPDWELVSIDYNQMEIIIQWAYSKFTPDSPDYNQHDDTAATLDIVYEKAKEVNFGIQYGMGKTGMMKQLGCTAKRAKELLDKYWRKYWQLAEVNTKVKNAIRERGFIYNKFGRRRRLDNDSHWKGLQFLVSGTCADIIKFAMNDIDQYHIDKKLESYMVLQIHDELIFMHKKSENLIPIWEEIMLKHSKDITGILKCDHEIYPERWTVKDGQGKGSNS